MKKYMIYDNVNEEIREINVSFVSVIACADEYYHHHFSGDDDYNKDFEIKDFKQAVGFWAGNGYEVYEVIKEEDVEENKQS